MVSRLSNQQCMVLGLLRACLSVLNPARWLQQPPDSQQRLSASQCPASAVPQWMKSGSRSQSVQAVQSAMCHRITVFLSVSPFSAPSLLLTERTEPSECCWCCLANHRSHPSTSAAACNTDPVRSVQTTDWGSVPNPPPVIASTRQHPAVQCRQLTSNVNGDRWCWCVMLPGLGNIAN